MNKSERLEQVEELFHAVLELDSFEAAEFLANACADDPLLQKEVEALLAIYYRDKSLLQSPATRLSAVAVADFILEKQKEEPVESRIFGNYRIIEEIGRGGMSTVYLGERADSLYDKQVAIKLLKRGLETDSVVERFLKERQILAALEHPGIARLIDGGTTKDGLPFVVMEYVEGASITEYCDSTNLSVAGRLSLFRKVCSAIQFAHQNSIIHRDIKPGNILVTKGGIPKILDFGIAKAISESLLPETATTTVTELRVMTPEYASPEQVRGEKITAASDVYSLGVLLYELLTGRRPYYFKSKSAYEIARVVCEQEPENPGSRSSTKTGSPSNKVKSRRIYDSLKKLGGRRDLSPGYISGDLENILLKALRKEPDRRYQSVEDFSEDIYRYLKGMPVKARKDTLTYRGLKFYKRHKASILMTCVVAVLCLFAGFFFSRLSAGHREPSESIAVIPFSGINRDANSEYLADAITNSLITGLSPKLRLLISSNNAKFLNQEQELDYQEIGRQFDAQTILTGSIISEGENLSVYAKLIDADNSRTIWSKRYLSKSSELLSVQREILQDASQNLGLTFSSEEQNRKLKGGTEDAKAYNLYTKGQFLWNQRTLVSIKQAREYFDQAIERDPNFALAYTGLANSYFLLSVWGSLPANEAFPKVKSAALKALEIEPELAEAHTSLAVTHWLYEWNWEAADREFKTAMEINPQYVTAPHWRGLFLAEMGRFDEAVESEKKALEITPRSIPVNADLARVLFYARRYQDSLNQYQKTIEMNPNFGAFYAELGQLYEQLGMIDEWYDALDKFEAFGNPAIREAYQTEGMKGYWRKLLDRYKSQEAGNWHSEYAKGELYSRLGEKDQAFESLNKAYELRDHKMAQLKVNPALDNLRSDPRFAELLRRTNFSNY